MQPLKPKTLQHNKNLNQLFKAICLTLPVVTLTACGGAESGVQSGDDFWNWVDSINPNNQGETPEEPVTSTPDPTPEEPVTSTPDPDPTPEPTPESTSEPTPEEPIPDPTPEEPIQPTPEPVNPSQEGPTADKPSLPEPVVEEPPVEEPPAEEPPAEEPPVVEGYFGEMTDASCSDGQYIEVLPDLTVDVSAEISFIAGESNPSLEQVKQSMMDILSQTYPFGAYLIDQSPGFDRQNDCAAEWANTQYSWVNRFGLAVHECGHAMNSYFGERNTYYISEGYSIPEMRNDYFPRSELTEDAYHALIPDAAANSTYFNVGSVTGHQGIQTMYDEWSQYIHSVAMDYSLYRYPEARRDFYVKYMLNFAWAAQRYLLWAKNQHPEDFASMLADQDLREATLVLWGQTWTYYDALINNTSWEPSDTEEAFIEAIRDPSLQDILNEVREAHGCEGKKKS